MHIALYRSERPEQFEEIIGQRHIVRILQNQIRTGQVSQAYLFTGTRGTGKTTTARILAKAVNCTGSEGGRVPCGVCENCRSIKEGTFLDVVELDAASNNGVDDLRAIIDSVQYPPVLGRYKVYIIDEVHMLSASAENAFLKTLEEPPDYAIFILATTDPEKVRQTIKSRCMTLPFKRVSEKDLTAGMHRICDKKGVEIETAALEEIALKADGSVRDALSILEQCISTGDMPVTRELVLEYTGSVGEEFYLHLTEAARAGEIKEALLRIDEMIRSGRDPKQMLADWLLHCRNLMLAKYVEDAEEILRSSPENIERIRAQAEEMSASEIERAVRRLAEFVNLTRYSTQPRTLLEVAAVQMMELPSEKVPRAPRAEKKRPPVERPRRVAIEPQEKKEPEVAREPQPFFEPPVRQDGAEDRHVGELEAAGSLDEMWERIVDELAAKNTMFRVVVANHSRLTDYRNDEMVVTVKRNKLALAESYLEDMTRVAKQLYGARTYLVLKGGEVTPPLREETSVRATCEMQEELEERDTMVDELAEDAKNLLGVEVTIIDN